MKRTSSAHWPHWSSRSRLRCRKILRPLYLLREGYRSFLRTCLRRFLTTANRCLLHGVERLTGRPNFARHLPTTTFSPSSDVALHRQAGPRRAARSRHNPLMCLMAAFAMLLGSRPTTQFSASLSCGDRIHCSTTAVYVSAPPDSWNWFYGIPNSAQISLWDELSSIYRARRKFSGDDQPDPASSTIFSAASSIRKKKRIELKPNVRAILVHRRRTQQSFSEKIMNRPRHGLAAQHRFTSQVNFFPSLNYPKRNTTAIAHLMMTSASKK